MLKQMRYIWLLLAVLLTAGNAHADYEKQYLIDDELPDAFVYLPGPPDSTMLATNGDYAKWIWGKSMRNTSRGEQASWESKFGIVRMCTIYSDVLGIDISEDNTPAIYRLMRKAGYTGAGAVAAMKSAIFRKRPFVIMNEDTWGQYDRYEELVNSSAYPSSHTGFGWGTALALAEMAPHMQDTILRRGYEYGISRVIVGAHWMSDIDAAITCASAAIARSHATAAYHADMEAARAEYMQIKGLSESEINPSSIPTANKIIPAPAMNDSYFFYGEVAPYWQAMGERDTERGAQAITDANLDDNVIIGGFSQCAGIDISSATLPKTTQLLKTVKVMLGVQAFMMKDFWYRNRPYVQLGDSTSVPEDEETYRNESSYPSGHAIIGWGMALVLTEVMPQLQNPILKRGYDIGWSRVITGYHYPADVQAGRVMAACLLAKMHNETYFTSLLEAAKQEYAATVTGNDNLSVNEPQQNDTLSTPETTNSIFTGDFYQWIWGKQMRETEKGEIAQHDSQCGIDQLCSIYGEVLGIDINENATPSIYDMISQVAEAGISSTQAIIERKRPYELMNEQPWGDNDALTNLNDSVSHPSAHAAMVWSTALALAQMAPQMQDTILARAMQCATSGVITGACWQSDVNTATTCASAAIANLRSTDDFQTTLTAARDEYMQIKGLSENDMNASFPVITKILDTPSGVDDHLFVNDLFTHWQAKELRATERGAQADADESMDNEYLISTFASCSPLVKISESNTPNIAMFIEVLKLAFNSRANSLKSTTTYRRRPYVQYNEPIPYGGDAWQHYPESSYPSRHAMIGWGIALALAELMPDCKDEILNRGFEYGESRLIKGSNYYSDVIAARVIAACDLGKLHNETVFNTLLQNAKNEYQQKKDEADLESIIATSKQNDALWYSINGIIYDTKPPTPGIHINTGKKVVIK